MAHRHTQDYAFETEPSTADPRVREAADSTLEREAQEYVERHVDPELLPPPEPEPGFVARTLDALTRTEDPIALTQGAFYMATGAWPLINIASFEAVTGPKTDRWLVKTVGALVALSGAAMASAGLRGRITPETRLLAMGSSLALAAVDVVYARKRRISRIYLLDAVAEVGLVLAWLTAMGRQPDELEPVPA